jgi:hypothetical protein
MVEELLDQEAIVELLLRNQKKATKHFRETIRSHTEQVNFQLDLLAKR